MDKSITVSTNLFEHLFAAYQSNPTALQIPAIPAQQIELLDTTKVEIADALAHSNIDIAQQMVVFAWAIANQTDLPEHKALAHWCHALLLSNRDIRNTLTHFDQALLYYRQENRTEEEGRILIGYAHHLNLLGRLDEAEAAILRAISALRDLPNYRDWPIAYLNAAYIQGQRGNYRAMWESARQAEERAKTLGAKNPTRADYYEFLCGNALVNQGLAALALAAFSQAELLLTSGLRVARKHDASELLGRAALNLGRLATYRGQLFEALQWLDQARQAFVDAEIEIDQATVALEKSVLYARLMMASQARSAALEAAQAFAKAGIVSESVEATLMAVRVSVQLEEAKRAALLLAEIEQSVPQAAPLQRLLYQGYCGHPLLLDTDAQKQDALTTLEDICQSLNALGAKPEMLEMTLLHTQLAVELTDQSVQTIDPPHQYQQVVQHAQESDLPLIEYRALIALAAHQPPKESGQTLRRAADLIVDVRQQMQPEELKANLLSGYLPVYKELIAVQRKSNQISAATQTLLEAKGGIWSDMARPSRAQSPSKAWVQARADLTQWQDELRWALESGEIEPDFVALCHQKIVAAEYALTEATRSQPRLRPNNAQPIPSTYEVQKQIAASACVLEYLVGQQNIDVCLLKKTGKPLWIQLGKTQDVQRIMGRLNLLLTTIRNAPKTDSERQQIATAQQDAIDRLLAHLYELLINPIEQHIADSQELILAPDEFLFEVPWSALLIFPEMFRTTSQKAEMASTLLSRAGQNISGTHYLGEKKLISLLPSSALLAMKQTQTKRQVDSSALLLGNPGIPALTHLDAELARIQLALPNSWLINPAASTDLAWQRAPSVLHIAAHGQINPRSPLLSGLDLADGPFLLADVLNLNLQGTHLVTLSACQTGAIPEKGGVLLALAGAFLCAGANHVLASLWPVDDEATALFMQTFYTHFQEHNQPAHAQQQAQETLRSAGYRHPFYWAAFQLLSGFKE